MRGDLPAWRVALNWVCGVEMVEEGAVVEAPPPKVPHTTPHYSTPQVVLSPEEEAEAAADFLLEPHWKRNVVNANAVLVMAVAMFFWGFYA